MDKLQFSIIFGVIRPEINERLSVGLITVVNNEIKVKYSRKKINALKHLFSPKAYEQLNKVIYNIKRNRTVNSIGAIDYMTRYSNNLLSVSQLQTVDIEPTKKSEDWLYRTYVYEEYSLKVT